MENELRFYLKKIKEAMEEGDFDPQYIVTAVQLPTGSIEIAINHEKIFDKINYILEAYDDDMKLNTNRGICMMQLMVV